MTDDFTHRWAVMEDLDALKVVMNLAIEELQKGFLSPEQLEASKETMGLDTQLVEDGTYLVIESGQEIVGCGGWSMRSTLFGGDHSAGRDASFLDPEKDAARIRAMYTHPNWVRRGIGSMVMEVCEQAARDAGFKRTELMATMAGEPLYRKCGYEVAEEHFAETSMGIPVPLLRMEKQL